jgi:hypothetical protein
MGDLREDLNAALESHDTEDENTQGTPAGLEAESNSDQETISDETPTDVPTSQSDSDTSTPPVENEASSSAIADKADTSNNSLKAPLNWSPQQREEWSKIPRHLQEKIISREKEMDQAVAGTAEARKTHEYLAQLGQQYAPVLAAEGINNPIEAVEGLFRSVAALRMGSPVQKAEMLAHLVKTYGVDIRALDDALVGVQPQETQQNQFEALIDQKMQPINQLMQQLNMLQQQGQQQTRAQADQEVAQFAQSAEFLNDVRNDMADLIDLANKQGRSLSLQEAYDRACAIHPEISKVMEQRRQTEAITGGNQRIAQKKMAASSLNGRQVGTGGGVESLSIRDQLNAAWDDIAAN